ncbi:MAG: dTMP kinase [Candidatus Obscuribacterales bacterium]|nr:dTMP kinase [Candidatus Obscuribacterales bacterium]
MPEQYPGKLVVIEGTDGVGRSTQAAMLKHWLEVEGYGVIISEWNSSTLISNAINKAKSKNALNTVTFSLLYATDLADRLNSEIIPALKSGFIVIADRYFYTAFARDAVRGADAGWLRKLYGFAPAPDLVFYLRMPIDELLKRIICSRGGLDFYESGRDLGMSSDLYQSFKLYQSKIVHEYERMVDEYQFKMIDAAAHPQHVQKLLRANLSRLLAESKTEPFVNSNPAVPVNFQQ